MRINEVIETDTDLPFDIVDDIHVFMKNDPKFYRKMYYPMVNKMQKVKDTTTQKKCIKDIVKPACNHYCKNYKINKKPEDLLDKPSLESLVNKIYSEEMQNISKGEYK